MQRRFKCFVLLMAVFLCVCLAILVTELSAGAENGVGKGGAGHNIDYSHANLTVHDVQYLPPGIERAANDSVSVLVSLHGSKGLAEPALRDWKTYGEKGGFAVVSLQWWLGGDRYLAPEEVYRELDLRLHALKEKYPAIRLHGNMIVGFSRSATYMPVLALIDRASNKNIFVLYLLNAGAWPADNPPPYMARHLQNAGRLPYKGKHFCAYYGDQDEFRQLPARDGALIKADIEQQGGVFDAFIVLPEGRHNTLVTRADLVDRIMSVWEGLRR